MEGPNDVSDSRRKITHVLAPFFTQDIRPSEGLVTYRVISGSNIRYKTSYIDPYMALSTLHAALLNASATLAFEL